MRRLIRCFNWVTIGKIKGKSRKGQPFWSRVTRKSLAKLGMSTTSKQSVEKLSISSMVRSGPGGKVKDREGEGSEGSKADLET